MQSFLKSYGPSNIKKLLWDKEFSGNKWDFIDDTIGDCVYPTLEKYSHDGSILDLGCGPGNTANELATSAYRSYVGVDISAAALEKASKRTEKNGRGSKNSFELSDIINYVPKEQFDVILFRESLYHVPMGKIKPVLERYSQFLRTGGVFIVRMGMGAQGGQVKNRPKAMIDIIETNFDVVEKTEHGELRDTVIVFRLLGLG
jgi:SAM-dependent methyltransferase